MTEKTISERVEEVLELDKLRTQGQWKSILAGSIYQVAIYTDSEKCGYLTLAMEEESEDSLQLMPDGSSQPIDIDFMAKAPEMAQLIRDLKFELDEAITEKEIWQNTDEMSQKRIKELEGEKIERNKAINFQAEIVQSLQKTIVETREVNTNQDKLLKKLAIDNHEAQLRVIELEEAITKTLVENGHLADGDNCTLRELKLVMPQKPSEGV